MADYIQSKTEIRYKYYMLTFFEHENLLIETQDNGMFPIKSSYYIHE